MTITVEEYFACARKHRYNTHEAARKAKKKFQNKKGRRKKPIRVYQCPHCEGWHLTSKERHDHE